MTPSQARMLPVLALLVTMLLWSSSFIAMKVAVMELDPMLVMFGRMTAASLCFACCWRSLRRVTYRKGDWKPLLFMSLCEPCAYFVFEAYALRYTSASQAGMVVSTMPLFVAMAAFIFLRERLSRQVWAGFAVALCGVVWLTLAGEATEHASNPLLGNILECLAMASATGYVVTAKRLSSHYPPLFITAVQAFTGMVFFMPLAFRPGTALPETIPLLPALAVVYLGVAISLVAYGFYNYGVSKMPAGQASAFINLIPVLTLLMGQVFLDEVFTPQQYVAAALVLAGVVLSQTGSASDSGQQDTGRQNTV
ncbi:DMT family transporter [Oleidesulfovibrio alaskensis]|uniref:DMT family transporter n=1 Tax=Oleidesulfovibrio alaskensis TaxID=58180 RepID=UPI0004080581|nr:DMT family transporter [Oleidesulfovibrio alaskensis]